ncbi:NAD(P)-binding protein [Rickenella mellea]|uniref:NAD(P)-binding protein n=1 Tax=Rickenella mellea TaxID=50990 RepID=A0A4Y7QB55_9AGAM|nr:NAD(P)-binding protein [Rickenella mellea]
MTSVFFLGATGYIGGAVLVALKSVHPELEITALVRSQEKATAVQRAGAAKVIIGSHDEVEKIQSKSAESDIVVNAADADDLPLTIAIIAGLKERAKLGLKPILLHTSGTGVVSVNTKGGFTPDAEKIWNDNKEDDIRSISPSQPHREIDLEIFKADEEGIISAYIIAPSTIYGVGSGPVNKTSQQIPKMIRVAVERKQTVYAGEGTNKWNNVHIHDLTDLYDLVFNLAISGKDTAKSPFEKFYFGSVGEHTWGEVARDIAPLLHKRGLVNSDQAISVPVSEKPGVTATTSRSVSERGFALGWKPKSKSYKESLGEDVEMTIA